MFPLKFVLMSTLMTATVVEKDNGTHNILLQSCLNANGCSFRGTSISWHIDEPTFKEGDQVYVSGDVECQEAFGVDERVTTTWVSYRHYICNGLKLNVVKAGE